GRGRVWEAGGARGDPPGLGARHQPRQAIRAFLAEIVDRSLKDPDRRGCLLVNSALDVAPHDARIGRVVAGYLDEIRAFFRRNLVAAREAGKVPRTPDPGGAPRHPLGVVLGARGARRTPAQPRPVQAAAPPPPAR